MKKLLSLLLLIPFTAFAWQPTKPINAYIGFTAGSGNEVSFRILEPAIAQATGANFIIQLKPGAGGAINSAFIVNAPNDGYTICICSEPSIVATDRIAMPNKQYSIKDFVPTIPYAGSTMSIIVNANDPINNIQDLILALQTEKITVGDPGAAARIVYELLASHVKFIEGPNNVVRVPYKGPSDTLNDVMAGHVRVGIMPLLGSAPAHLGKKVKIIAITSQNSIADLPGVKPMASVYPDFVFNLNWNITLPKGTPKDVADWYTRAINNALANPAVRQKFSENMMIVPKYKNSEEYQKYLLQQEKKYAPLVDKVISTQN